MTTSNIGQAKAFLVLMPRSLSLLLALLSMGAVLAYSVAHEAPMGRVHGRVVLKENSRPLAHARITLLPSDEENDPELEARPPLQRRHAVTDENGEFDFTRVTAGFYAVSAAAHAHAAQNATILVNEDETATVPISLARSQPDLQVTPQRRSFHPDETAALPVHGYVDAALSKGRDALRVRLFRTTLARVLGDTNASAAFSRIGPWEAPMSPLPHALLHPAGEAPRLISDEAQPITEADFEGFFHQRLKLKTPGPGLYLAEVSHGRNTVCAWLQVTDTALVVKHAGKQLLAYTVDSKSGQPRTGAAVRVLRAGSTIAQAKTDAQGLANFQLKSGEGGSRLMTLATAGNNEATVGQYDYESDESHGSFAVHTYTDRPIYRPGGRVYYKGIVRRKLDPGMHYAIPAGTPVDVEVRDASGDQVAREHLTVNRFGSFHGSVELSPEGATGMYSIVATVAGEEHTADFSVASYRKPEFTATVTPNEKHYTYGDTVEMFVDANYYFGAPVAGAKAHYTVSRATDWGNYYGDEYGDEEYDYDESEYEGEGDEGYSGGETVQEGDVTLDANGHAVIRFTANPEDKELHKEEGEGESEWREEPQDQTFSVQLTVSDVQKREVEASGSVPVSAGDFRLSTKTDGYFALPGQPTTLTITARDFADHPVANTPVELKCSYRKWDENGKAHEEFVRRYNATTGTDGVAKVAITPPRAGSLYINAQAADGRRRAIKVIKSLWITRAEGGDYDEPYRKLALLTDKKQYNAGEVARVLLNSERSGGMALVTIEGSRLFKAWLVPLTHRSTALRVPITADYGPNVTLAACGVRDHKFDSSTVPLRVEVPQREMRVAVKPERRKYQPGEKVTYQVATTDITGKPISCELSFGVVDEAIYALREDSPKAMRRAFYPRHPNAVRTSDSLEPLYLGDVNKAEPVIEARRKFLDTAFWQADLQTDSNGQATVTFALPDNLTTWRATAVAQTADTSFGRRVEKITVAKDFFVRLDTPRFFTGDDRPQVVAMVHNDTGKEQTATLKLEAAGLALGAEGTRSLRLEPGGVGQLNWPVTADPAAASFSNLAQLKLTAWTAKDAAGTQYTDGVELSVPVRPHGRERVQNFVGHINGDGAITRELATDPAALPGASRVTVRITPSVTDAVVGSLQYLIGFPYGCTEQTMSRFLPDILVERTLRQQQVGDIAARRAFKDLPRMVRDGLARLARFQHESGGWGWWEADSDDAWMTAYVLYGLSCARDAGYNVNERMLSRGREAAVKLLDTEKPADKWRVVDWDATRAFLLYAIACTSPTDEQKSVLRSRRAAFEPLQADGQTWSYLVLLDKKLGLGDKAWPELEKRMLTGDAGTHWEGGGWAAYSDWNDKTATALGLRAIVAHDPHDARIPSVLLWLMGRREDNTWGSTRDTAWLLEALCDYIKAAGGGLRPEGSVTLSLNDNEVANYSFNAQTSGEIVRRIPWRKVRTSRNVLALRRQGGRGPLFYTVQVRQTVAASAPLAAVSLGTPIVITREYRRVLARSSGDEGWSLQSEPAGNRLRQGDRLRVRLTFKVPRELSYVLIEDAFPAGCEVTERGSAEEGGDWEFWWSDTDVRDDRIAFFARHLTPGEHTIEYNLRAQTPGSYNALPTMLQAMYAPDVRAESAETRVTIQ